MRLVDVDELIEYFDGDLEGYDNREYILHMLDSKGRSAKVDAIPIEFIEKYLEKWKHAETYDIVHSWWLIIKRDWEKENEQEN